jgi:predicted GIY-YIG superfamily endonuclease
MKGYTYILQCSDGSYYVGSTNNLELRLAQHQAGEGANHTKKRLPVELVYYEVHSRIDEAFYREKQIQGWRRAKKEALINGEYDKLPELAKAYGARLPSASSDSVVGDGDMLPSTKLPSAGSGSVSVVEPVIGSARWLSLPKPPLRLAETTAIKESLGNTDILKLPKTAFLCSRNISASAVLKCYDWAIAQREAGNCVISGFHSRIEKDVLHYLLKGSQPIIVAMARGLKTKSEPELIQEVEKGRLLIVTPFGKEIKRVTEKTAQIRNRMMLALADTIAIGHISEGGLLEALLKENQKQVMCIND